MKPRVGEVFVIPTGDGRVGVGQVVGAYGDDALYLAIFDRVLSEADVGTQASDVVAGPVALLALSLDAKLHAGHWTVVGSADVDPRVPMPAYKESVGSPSDVDVVDYTGKRRRPATEHEADVLPYRRVVAPVRLERALRASLGLEPWLDVFDELKAGNIITTEAAFDQ